MSVRFYIGLHNVHDAAHFPRACLSIRRLKKRRKPIDCAEVLIDSGAFMELLLHGGYRSSVAEYAADLRRLDGIVQIKAAVAQDYMCEPFMLERTGLSVADHQRLTIERYDELVAEDLPFPIMPVLQGYRPAEYQRHVAAYGARLAPGQWVGVGSVCKRNANPEKIIEVLSAIHAVRPDLRLRGFGIKRTALGHAGVREMLYSADSMAWSEAARKEGRDRNSWREARAFCDQVETIAASAPKPWQMPLPLWEAA